MRELTPKPPTRRGVRGFSACSRAGLAALALVVAPVAHADPADPAPINGTYETFLDHSRQTFNGSPEPSDPSTQAASFTTDCDASGCTAHWFRLTDLAENPNAPALYDYRWNGFQWESSSDYPFHCDGGGTTPSVRSDFLRPLGGGIYYGERTFTVTGPGCAGDGPGTYWLPFTLTPTGVAPTS